MEKEKSAVEWLQEQYNQCPKYEERICEQDWEKAKAMEQEALAIIRKFVNEFDEQGEVSWNTRDEAQNFLNNL